MTKKRKKKRAPGAGRPKGITDKPRTASLSIRVSVHHKAQFCELVPKKERRRWLERIIESLGK